MSVPTFDYRDDPAQYEAWGADIPSGLHLSVPFDRYLRWPYVSQSGLKTLARSPGHYQLAKLQTLDSKAVDIGSALDDSWLEDPEKLVDKYAMVPWPPPCKNDGTPYSNWLVSTDGKAWKADNEHRTILTFDDVLLVCGMMLKLNEHPIASDLRRRSRTQASIVWDCPQTGIRCKGRFDMLAGDKLPYEASDLKSTTVVIDPMADKDPFWDHATRLGYHLQAGWYTWGLEIITGEPHTDYRIVAVEQKPPHTVEVYRYYPDDIEAAREITSDLLGLYADCKRGEISWNRTSTNREHNRRVPVWAWR